ncbi:MAG: hypothetical protein WC615_00420 [Mucilaginibacter sp.]|jgi:hypothetical protein|uniref:hypothetical protein n=1 Tax=Mucilaginibacter sp. TaxID=1882438 RepID=UPI00356B4945
MIIDDEFGWFAANFNELRAGLYPVIRPSSLNEPGGQLEQSTDVKGSMQLTLFAACEGWMRDARFLSFKANESEPNPIITNQVISVNFIDGTIAISLEFLGFVAIRIKSLQKI